MLGLLFLIPKLRNNYIKTKEQLHFYHFLLKIETKIRFFKLDPYYRT